MGLFDFFKKDKKEENNYDPTNIKVTDLRKGFVFDYDLKTWVVKEEFLYDWGNNFFSREYKINSGEEEKFLSVEDDDGLFLSVLNKVNVRSVQEDLPEYILKNDRPPKKIVYKNITFYYDSESVGSLKESDEDEAKFISWDFYDEDEKHVLNVEQWGEEEFEASFGQVIKEFEISNILPSN